MRAPASALTAILASATLCACSWNPLSWGASSPQPCFYKQGGEAVGDCAVSRTQIDDNGATASAAVLTATALNDIGARLRDAPVAPPKVIGAFNAIGNSAMLMQPRVFEPEREAVATNPLPEQEVVLTVSDASRIDTSANITTTQHAGTPSVSVVADRFTGVIRVVRPGSAVQRGVVPVRKGSTLTADLTGNTEPAQRNFQIGFASSGTGSARLRALLVKTGSGSTGNSQGASSSSGFSDRNTYTPGSSRESDASAERSSRLTALLGQTSSHSSTGTASLSSSTSEGVSSATSRSSSSRPSILDRLRSSSSSAGTTRSSTSSSRGDTAQRSTSSYSPRGTFVLGGGTTSSSDYVPRGTLVSGSGQSSSDDYTPRGTLVSAGGSQSSDTYVPRGTLVSGGGSSSSEGFTPAVREHCPRNRSLLGALYGDAEITTGKGWTFPGLINGDCPIGVGLIKVNTEGSPFGSMDF